jgi:hypothetical protein
MNTKRTERRPLLFSLQEYDRAFGAFVLKATNDMMSEKQPLLKRIQRVQSGEITVTQNTAPDGTVVSNEPIMVGMPVIFNTEGVINGKIDEEIGTAIDASAEAALQQIMPQLLDYVGRLSDAFGNTIKATSGLMSQDMILDFIERVPIEFDESGQPDLSSYVLVQQQVQNGKATVITFDLLELMQSLPLMTEMQQSRFTDLIERKRHENSAHKRHRQLY